MSKFLHEDTVTAIQNKRVVESRIPTLEAEIAMQKQALNEGLKIVHELVKNQQAISQVYETLLFSYGKTLRALGVTVGVSTLMAGAALIWLLVK